MKLLCIAVAFSLSGLVSGQKYTQKYDNLELEEMLANRRLLLTYVKCVLDTGRCTPEGKELRAHISDALMTGCSKCTPNQKEGAKMVIAHLIRNEPEYWKLLVEKYDPLNTYSTKYEKELEKVLKM